MAGKYEDGDRRMVKCRWCGSDNSNLYTSEHGLRDKPLLRVLINASNNGCDQAVSNNATAIIAADLLVTTQPTNIIKCRRNSTMTVAVSGWIRGSNQLSMATEPDGTGSWTNASGSGSTTAVFTPESLVTGTTYYRVLVNASNSGCNPTVSNTATAVISPDLTVTTQPSNLNECIGGTATISVVVAAVQITITYQWQSSPNGTNTWSNASGTGNATATYTPSSSAAGTTLQSI